MSCQQFDGDCQRCVASPSCSYCRYNSRCLAFPESASCPSSGSDDRPYTDKCQCLNLGTSPAQCMHCIQEPGCEYCGPYLYWGSCNLVQTNSTTPRTCYDGVQAVQADYQSCPLLYPPYPNPPTDFNFPNVGKFSIGALVVILVLTIVRIIYYARRVWPRPGRLMPRTTRIRVLETVAFLLVLATVVTKLVGLALDEWYVEPFVQRHWGLLDVTYDGYMSISWLKVCRNLDENPAALQHQAALCQIGVAGIAFTLMFHILSTAASFLQLAFIIGSKLRPRDLRFRAVRLWYLGELTQTFSCTAIVIWPFVSLKVLRWLSAGDSFSMGSSFWSLFAAFWLDTVLGVWFFAALRAHGDPLDAVAEEEGVGYDIREMHDEHGGQPEVVIGPDQQFIDPFGPLFPSNIPAGGVRAEGQTEGVAMEPLSFVPQQDPHGEPSPAILEESVPAGDSLESDPRASLIVPTGPAGSSSDFSSASEEPGSDYEPPAEWEYHSATVAPEPSAAGTVAYSAANRQQLDEEAEQL